MSTPAESCCPTSIFLPCHSMKWNGNFRTFLLRGFWQIKGDKLATRPLADDREPMFFARVHSSCKQDRGGTEGSAVKKATWPYHRKAAREMQSHASISFSLHLFFPAQTTNFLQANTLFLISIISNVSTLPPTLQLWQRYPHSVFPPTVPCSTSAPGW